MDQIRQHWTQLKPARWVTYLVIVVTMLVLGLTVFYAHQRIRGQIQQQIAGRDGEILLAMSLIEQEKEDAGMALADSLEDPTSQYTLMLTIASYRGFLAARLFDVQGKFLYASSTEVKEADLANSELSSLGQLKPQSRFHPHAQLSDYFLEQPANSTERAFFPLLEVNVPLHRKGEKVLLGIAQFIINGASIATEYAALDRHLLRQSLVISLAGALVIGLVLGWAFYRLEHTNRLLRLRTAHLLRANQDLSLAAKTSAVGAVTAHLFHGLRNPLAGLHSLMAHRSGESQASQEEDWALATATTHRMKAMVDEVVRVVREDEAISQYELSVDELIELVAGKVQPLAQTTGVQFRTDCHGEAVLTNREANLILLILDNLIRNALQATPPGKTVTLTFRRETTGLVFAVRDEGPGFPEALKSALFTPCRSSKEGGSGIGLAISKQLAHHLGAELTLSDSSAAGCLFLLTIPINMNHNAVEAEA